MSISYSYNASALTLTASPSGVVTISDIHQYFDRVTIDPAIGEIDVEVVEFESVLDFAFSYRETLDVRSRYRELRKQKGTGLTLFVAPHEYQFGMARMLATVLGDEFPCDFVRSTEEIQEAIRNWKNAGVQA